MLYQTAVPAGSSLGASGTASAPTAGTNFVAIAAPFQAGMYEVECWYIITGAQETAAQNLQVRVNATVLLSLPTAMTFSAAVPQKVKFYYQLNGTDNVQLRVVANAVASTVYTGNIVATRIG